MLEETFPGVQVLRHLLEAITASPAGLYRAAPAEPYQASPERKDKSVYSKETMPWGRPHFPGVRFRTNFRIRCLPQ